MLLMIKLTKNELPNKKSSARITYRNYCIRTLNNIITL